MEIETDYVEVKLRGQSVGFRTCIICGKTFAKDMQHPKRQKCQECYEIDPHSHHKEEMKTTISFIEQKRNREIEENKRRERMRNRDAAYARWERDNGVSPRFEINGNKLVEIRGRIG